MLEICLFTQPKNRFMNSFQNVDISRESLWDWTSTKKHLAVSVLLSILFITFKVAQSVFNRILLKRRCSYFFRNIILYQDKLFVEKYINGSDPVLDLFKLSFGSSLDNLSEILKLFFHLSPLDGKFILSTIKIMKNMVQAYSKRREEEAQKTFSPATPKSHTCRIGEHRLLYKYLFYSFMRYLF